MFLGLRRKLRAPGSHSQHLPGEASEERILCPFSLARLDGVHNRDDQIKNPAPRKNQPDQREESKESSGRRSFVPGVQGQRREREDKQPRYRHKD